MQKKFPNDVNLDQLNALLANCMVGHLGIKFIEANKNYLIASMPVDQRTTQPFGLLHGGATATLAETLGSIASQLIIDDQKFYTVGIEITAQHLKKVSKGIVEGKVSQIQLGRTLHIWRIEVFNEAQELIALCKLNAMVMPKK